MFKDQLFKVSGLQFDNWLFGPKKFSGFEKRSPGAYRGLGKELNKVKSLLLLHETD